MKVAIVKKISRARLVLAGTGVLLLNFPAWSQSSSLGAHVHGEAELMIAIEDKRIEMEFVSPAADTLGFEQAPNTEDQRNQIHLAEEILSKADELFGFDGASCESTSTSVNMPFENADHEDPQNEHAGHEENQEHSDHDEHSEVTARYVFECNSELVAQIQILFFAEFPAIESINTQWITPTKQGSKKLNADNLKIELR